MIECVKNFNLSHCALAICSVLKWANLLDGDLLSSPLVVCLPAQLANKNKWEWLVQRKVSCDAIFSWTVKEATIRSARGGATTSTYTTIP